MFVLSNEPVLIPRLCSEFLIFLPNVLVLIQDPTEDTPPHLVIGFPQQPLVVTIFQTSVVFGNFGSIKGYHSGVSDIVLWGRN